MTFQKELTYHWDMKTSFAFSLIGLLSLNVMAQQPRSRQAPPVRRQQQEVVTQAAATPQIYSFEAPGPSEFQLRIDLGLQTGSLRFSNETQTQRVEGVQTNFSAAFGLSNMLSLGARGSYLNSTSGGTVASTSRASATKSGLGDAEIFATTKISPSRLALYLTLTGGIKTGDFEWNSVSGESTNTSGGYYIEPSFAASMPLGLVLIGGGISYRYHLSREVKSTSTYGTEVLRLDPGNVIRGVINTEIQTTYPFGAEVEYIMVDRYEALSLLGTNSRLTFGNTNTLVTSLYSRFPTNLGFGKMDFVPWISYASNLGKKRGVANVDEDQLLSFILKVQMSF